VKAKKDHFEVNVPTWRSNGVKISEDLVEEIVRIYGYSNVPGTPPTIELTTPVKNHKRHVKRTLQNILIGLGFQEESNYSFLSDDHLKKLGYNDRTDIIEVANPVSEDFRFMRPNFLPYLLANLSRNELLEGKEWRTFEMGAVYKTLDKQVIENHLLTLLISSGSEQFFQMKGVVESMLQELSLPVTMIPAEHLYAHPKKCLAVMSGEKIIGHLYEIHPLLKKNFKVRGNVILFEADLSTIVQTKPQEVLFQQINRNPMALLDISIIVDENTLVSEYEHEIRSVEPQFLRQVELMDVYQGENIGKGKKSFTFALSYQHPERTFDDKEIGEILKSLIKKLEEKGGIVRK
jgi:phenylalanyl-tRNA synthetase beta chain